MEQHVTEALQNYAKGYTCSQAVLCAFANEKVRIAAEIVNAMCKFDK
jgi:hypothetical protein